MQFLRATSSSIDKDRFYQSKHERRKSIDLQKIRLITSNNLLPLKADSTILMKFRKTKSVQKTFQKQQGKLNFRLKNQSSLTKLISVQSTLKPLRIKQTPKTHKFYERSNNWDQRKKETQILRKQNEMISKRYEKITNTDLKNMKQKIQVGIKEYLDLRENIKKMRALSTTENKSIQMNFSQTKIILRLPISSTSSINDPSIQQYHLPQKVDNTSIQFPQRMNSQAKQRQFQGIYESHQQNIFTEVLKLRQLRKLNFFKDNKTIKEKINQQGDFKKASQIILT